LISIGYDQLVVLIVDDEPHTRTLIKSQLRQIGIRSIIEAGDGKAGLTEVLRTRPHLVLCDVHMQPMDGRDFLKTLRAVKVEALRRTPVIFLTGDAQTDTVMFAKEHAVDGYLVKPVSLDDIKARIDRIMKG